MKNIKLVVLPAFLLLFIVSCSSVKVLSDYDKEANFNNYKTYAFYKTGIDKAEISDLDKKRILRAIETEMAAKGFTLSENPDLLVSIFTKEREQVDIYNNWGGYYGGWGWSPYYWGWGPGYGFGYGSNVSTSTEGSLYIDVRDSKDKQLVWQGRGVGTLGHARSVDEKAARSKEFVSHILEQYAPEGVAAK